MIHSSLTKLVVILLLIFSLCTKNTFAEHQSPQDSIRKILPSLSGGNRLQALADILAHIAMGDDIDAELEALNDLRMEANKQGNVEIEGLARLKQIFCFYNYNMFDSLETVLPKHLEFMAKNGQWDYYYNGWEAKVEKLLYANQTQTALKETQLMYDDAKARDNNYGLGVSAHTLGIIYQTLQRYELAEKSFDEAINRLSKEEDISLLLNTYNTLCETLDASWKFEKMLNIADAWKVTIDDYKRRAEERGITPMLNGRYLYCYLALTIANFETGNTIQAERYLKISEECAKGRSMIAQFKLLHIQTRFFEHLGQYEKAIAIADTNYNRVISFGDSISALTVLENKARILRKAGKGIESALVYEEVMQRKDSLRNLEFAGQLDELRTIYEVDKLELEAEKSRLKLKNSRNLAALFSTLALVLAGFALVILFNQKKLKEKNRSLYHQITEQRKLLEKSVPDTPKSIVEETVEGAGIENNELMERLNALMRSEQSYTQAGITRKAVADMLNTNETYLFEAIKKCYNLTWGEYLNVLRLDHARDMLATPNCDLTIEAVAIDSGFGSRNTFYRLFRERFGLTPVEFRNLACEKKG